MRKTLALLFLGLAMAQEVVVYPGYAEIREPVVLPPSAWVFMGGEACQNPPGLLAAHIPHPPHSRR
jgi:hypothetical protein